MAAPPTLYYTGCYLWLTCHGLATVHTLPRTVPVYDDDDDDDGDGDGDGDGDEWFKNRPTMGSAGLQSAPSSPLLRCMPRRQQRRPAATAESFPHQQTPRPRRGCWPRGVCCEEGAQNEGARCSSQFLGIYFSMLLTSVGLSRRIAACSYSFRGRPSAVEAEEVAAAAPEIVPAGCLFSALFFVAFLLVVLVENVHTIVPRLTWLYHKP